MATKYIEADKVENITYQTPLCYDPLNVLAEVRDKVRELPAADVAPVKHGRWIWNNRLGEWYCSECDRIMTPYIVEKSDGEYAMAQPFYCGWCGAKMDEVQK